LNISSANNILSNTSNTSSTDPEVQQFIAQTKPSLPIDDASVTPVVA